MAFTSKIEVARVKTAGQDLIDNTSKMYEALSSISAEIQGNFPAFRGAAQAGVERQGLAQPQGQPHHHIPDVTYRIGFGSGNIGLVPEGTVAAPEAGCPHQQQ